MSQERMKWADRIFDTGSAAATRALLRGKQVSIEDIDAMEAELVSVQRALAALRMWAAPRVEHHPV